MLEFVPELVEERCLLYHAMHKYGESRGHARPFVEDLFDTLPPELQAAAAIRLKGPLGWRYLFGQPIDRMPERIVVGGSPEAPVLSALYDALIVANERLDARQRDHWSQRLADRKKHCDAREEMLPLVRVDRCVQVEFEVAGRCVGMKTADWFIKATGPPALLLDVKYRIRDTVDYLYGVVPKLNAGQTHIQHPEVDPAVLFKDTVEKFGPQDPQQILQGAWIRHSIKNPGALRHFDGLDGTRLHFVVFPGDGATALVLGRSPDQVARVCSVLGIVQVE